MIFLRKARGHTAKAIALKLAHGRCQKSAGVLTELVHTHSLRRCSLQLEKVIVKSAPVLTASLRRKSNIEVGAVGSQNNAVLGGDTDTEVDPSGARERWVSLSGGAEALCLALDGSEKQPSLGNKSCKHGGDP